MNLDLGAIYELSIQSDEGVRCAEFFLVYRIYVCIDLQVWCKKSVYAISTYQQERSLAQRDYKSGVFVSCIASINHITSSKSYSGRKHLLL